MVIMFVGEILILTAGIILGRYLRFGGVETPEGDNR